MICCCHFCHLLLLASMHACLLRCRLPSREFVEVVFDARQRIHRCGAAHIVTLALEAPGLAESLHAAVAQLE